MGSYEMELRHIDRDSVEALRGATLSPQALKKGICDILIESKGGDPNIGFLMMEIIRRSPIPVHATVDKEAGSTAAVILQSCHRRIMHKNAHLRYHYASWRVSFIIYFDEEIAEKNRKKGIDLQHRLILPIMERTGMNEALVHKILREDRPIGAQEALELKLVDEII
jgi:ATP-dependent protease ClpP protease subunit